MALSLERFNRIIDLSFITSNVGKFDPRGFALKGIAGQRSIVCPRHGIKPDIQINGTLGANGMLWAFHIMIKNFYFDLLTEQYSRVKVRAGYANKPITFEANIVNMYQQSPGPDGTTVVECIYGNLTQEWLDTMVNLNYDKGTKLTEILDALKNKLNATDKVTGKLTKGLSIEEPLQFEGSAREAFTRLEERFQDKHLQVFMRGDKLCAVCLTEGDFIEEHIIQYLSAPPRQTPGDKDGTWTTQITGPWMPEILPGDEVTIPLQTYIRNRQLVGGKKQQKMHVTKMSFHFGTRGSINQMTCDGYIVR